MESEMLAMAGEAVVLMADPVRLAYLAAGVLIGLSIGVVPGLGGITGMALLLPFTFDLDPYSAFAFLLGMASVTTTSDTIPGRTVRCSGNDGLRGHRARRASDGAERPSGPRLRCRIHGLDDRRRVRRAPSRGLDPDPAPGPFCPSAPQSCWPSRCSGFAWSRCFRAGHRSRASPPRVGVDAGDGRLRPADRHLSLDLRLALSLGWLATRPLHARPVRAARACRSRDRAAEHRRRFQDRFANRPVAGHSRHLPPLVAGAPESPGSARRSAPCPASAAPSSTGSHTAMPREPRRARPRPSARATSAAY